MSYNKQKNKKTGLTKTCFFVIVICPNCVGRTKEILVITIILAVLLAVAMAFAAFLLKEMFKKFDFMAEFLRSSALMVHYRHDGEVRGMQNIVLRGNEPFCVLVGFKMVLPVLGNVGFDYFGFVRSNDDGVAVICTYLGSGSCDFIFVADCDVDINPITASSTTEDQQLQPDVRYPPHPLLQVLPDKLKMLFNK
ncbi:MAG: hypothetical protein COU35_02750 [Candidatus Magasanikbacteria bacterium CG10_big_fil_rev_8_21_14_0_10_47_10]|uniref:Uncharacterized protein n=1 Tax=Candidatus Magasanikbacteria bacterium CG10_big_fil_rev_8_21_14_0_10_47_10 TaxID=1974652 RepID=A0A2H0TQC0_9BACT|nr:MAG: hypothetical protein COU35_02750 [Candidatus Magasanikbacteria bacterium CG10_big_fil_rev_8_21_14_0_10_47_10]